MVSLISNSSPSALARPLAPFLDQERGHKLVHLAICTSSVYRMITSSVTISTSEPKDPASDAPVSEHPKPEVPDLIRSEHVEQMRRVRVVNVVVCAAVRECEVDFVEGSDVGDGRCDIASWVDRWEIHVSLGVDRICGRHEMIGHVTGNG